MDAIIEKLHSMRLLNSLFENGHCDNTITDLENYTFHLDGLSIDELSHFKCDEETATNCYLVQLVGNFRSYKHQRTVS